MNNKLYLYAYKKAGDKWDSVKEFLSRPDVAGAGIGALVGGGLGAGAGMLTGKNKGLAIGVDSGLGALMGGTAGYGIGRSIKSNREKEIAQLKSDLKDIYYKNMDAPSQRFHFGENGGWKDDYSKEDWDHNIKGDLGVIDDAFAVHPDNIKKIRGLLKERLKLLNNRKLNDMGYELERRVKPEEFHSETVGEGTNKRKLYFRNKY